MEHHLTVARTARYQQLGKLSTQTRHVWFVCHGYGQLAAYFIRHFAFLVEADPSTVIIAPEGLSRFYLSGNGGRMGASWMTRDDRLHEINDHIGFLNQLAERVLAECPPYVQVTVLGFSQGTATVSRWLTQARFRPAHLVLWAGSFPDDIDATVAQSLLHALKLTIVIGSDDEYITLTQAEQQFQYLEQFAALTHLVTFPGKHELNRAILKKLAVSEQ
ncbi:alpha/beta hydrolase [Hymenobacter siberiensis]|jgi:predicted esterase|uniref:alpha/beta hydrolase n=1 Tax=Hymenobacter siberiensis TaxID=2848396 RepID=UPI001C1E4F6B|nr:phospholipase [Hymenobacter siberiensis]